MIAGRLGKIRRMIEGQLVIGRPSDDGAHHFFRRSSQMQGPVTECGGKADGGALGVAAKW